MAGGAAAQFDELEDELDPGQLEDALNELDLDELEDLGDLSPEQLEELADELGLDPDDLADLLDQGDEGENGEGETAEPDVEDGEGGDGEVPGAEIGGFVGTAEGTGLEVGVGLPEELADGLEPVLDGLGIRDEETGGIRLALAETQAELRRAGEGEEVDGLAEAIAANLLLDSDAADSPGVCEGVPETVELPPEQDTPLLTVEIANIDCEQDDERAFADATLAGANVSLAGLIEAGAPEDFREGLDEAIDALNEELLSALNDEVTCGVLDEIVGNVLPGSDACEALSLQLENPLDAGVPLVDVDLVGSTSEVTASDDEITADAEATLAGINVLGLACVGGDGTDPLTYSASVATDGESASDPQTTNPSAQVQLCPQDENILNLVSDDDPLDLIELLGEDVQNIGDEALEEVFEGLQAVLEELDTAAVTNGEPYTEVDGAGAVAGVTPLRIVGTAPFNAIPGLDEFLGDLAVTVESMGVEAAVNAEPDDPTIPAEEDPPAQPEEPSEPSEPARDLPETGAAAGLLGLAALGAAAALRRRED